MSSLYKSLQGERLVLARYREHLDAWPVSNQQRIVPTSLGDTFVLSCGDPAAPPLVLLHGAMGNSVTWRFDALEWSRHFRVHIIDLIGEAGLSAPTRPAFTDASYVTWFSEVTRALQLVEFNLVGESLGGWLALAFATAYPERIKRLALLCPAGIGTQKNFLAKVWPLFLLGSWGMRQIREMALGKMPERQSLSLEARAFMDFLSLVLRHFRPRQVQFPIFNDEQLAALTMPVFVIAGGKDVFFDSAETVQRLRRCCPALDVEFRPKARHLLRDRTQPILDFLSPALSSVRVRRKDNVLPFPSASQEKR